MKEGTALSAENPEGLAKGTDTACWWGSGLWGWYDEYTEKWSVLPLNAKLSLPAFQAKQVIGQSGISDGKTACEATKPGQQEALRGQESHMANHSSGAPRKRKCLKKQVHQGFAYQRSLCEIRLGFL